MYVQMHRYRWHPKKYRSPPCAARQIGEPQSANPCSPSPTFLRSQSQTQPPNALACSRAHFPHLPDQQFFTHKLFMRDIFSTSIRRPIPTNYIEFLPSLLNSIISPHSSLPRPTFKTWGAWTDRQETLIPASPPPQLVTADDVSTAHVTPHLTVASV